ncbi:MAG: flagellar hook basal-body protein [Deltaproteobacteria bacterium]|nr:flagellar hook basal-body protein [Deltaproteobacteria bacterium]
MASGMWVGLAGALARVRELDVVANNLANADTDGFKTGRVSFATLLETGIRDVGAGHARGAAGRVFPTVAPTALDLARGPVATTGGALDAAIDGDGFFAIETPAGPRYTRAGAFAIGTDGTLVTAAGHPVRGEAGPIVADQGPVSIRGGGAVVDGTGAVVGRLQVVTFDDPAALAADGAGLLRAAPDAAAIPVEDPQVAPGALERSNVRPAEQLASLVFLQRAFEISLRAMQADDQATGRLIQEMS